MSTKRKWESIQSLAELSNIAGAAGMMDGIQMTEQQNDVLLLCVETLKLRCNNWADIHIPFVKVCEEIRERIERGAYEQGKRDGLEQGKRMARHQIREMLGIDVQD